MTDTPEFFTDRICPKCGMSNWHNYPMCLYCHTEIPKEKADPERQDKVADNFIRWAEGYYGDYRPVVKAELMTWLRDQPEALVVGLRLAVRDSYSNQYRIPPDIATLHTLIGQETYDRGRDVMRIGVKKRDEITTADQMLPREGR